jgi:cobalt-zinc-cadmium efflux system protein
MIVEAVGGWLSNSLALLSDAGHMFTDAGALGLSLLALRIGRLPPTATKTFGYHRFEILAALFNGLALWALVGIVLHESYGRLHSPQEVAAPGMIAIAAIGLAVNLFSVFLLHSHKDTNLNVRGAFLHVVADSLGSCGALIAGFVILKTGWTVIDPLVSFGICLLILWSSWRLVREAVHILLLGVPTHLDYNVVESEILRNEGICCLYDLHIWTIGGGMPSLSAHLVIEDGYPQRDELLRTILTSLKEKFHIEHATLQIEESHELKEMRNRVMCSVGERHSACLLHGKEGERQSVNGHEISR